MVIWEGHINVSTNFDHRINLSNYSSQFCLAKLFSLPDLYFGFIIMCCCTDTLSFSRSHVNK